MQTQTKSRKMADNSAHNDSAPTLETLEHHNEFINRHIGPGDDQIKSMLSDIGVKSLNALIEKSVPASILTNSL